MIQRALQGLPMRAACLRDCCGEIERA